MEKVKSFFKKYGAEVIEWYLAAMVCYICMYTAGWGIWAVAVLIGVANVYLKMPIVNALHLGNADKGDLFEVKHMTVLKNILESIVICGILTVIFYLVDRYLFTTIVEPISFGILYELLHIGLSKILKNVCLHKK